MNPLRIALLWDDGIHGVLAGERADGTPRGDVRVAVAAVEQALRGAGHITERVGIDFPISRFLARLESGAFDLAFNLCEGVGDVATGEIAVTALLDLVPIRYTGSDPMALAAALDKARAKEILTARGIPTPRGTLLASGFSRAVELRFPLIVKPAREDGSLGIEEASVVRDLPALRARVDWVAEHFASASLAEEFVDGRELNVSVLGEGAERFALPIGEIDFSGMPEGRPRIVSFNAKWREDTAEFAGTVPVVPAPLTEPVAARVREAALRAAEAFGVRDYARVDLRLDRAENPWVLEVNPNPDISPDAGVPRAAKVHGWSYDRLILEVVAMAMRRSPQARRSVRLLEATASR